MNKIKVIYRIKNYERYVFCKDLLNPLKSFFKNIECGKNNNGTSIYFETETKKYKLTDHSEIRNNNENLILIDIESVVADGILLSDINEFLKCFKIEIVGR